MSLTLLATPNSNILIFAGLYNGLDKFNGVADPSINNATGTATLLNADGTDAGFTSPSWTYITGSKGNYAQCPSDWVITAGVTYKVRVQLQAPTGEVLDGIYDAPAQDRTA